MLSISDEDSRKSPSPGPRTNNTKSSTPERSGSHFSDSAVKPNFVYVVSTISFSSDFIRLFFGAKSFTFLIQFRADYLPSYNCFNKISLRNKRVDV